jgi:azurin
MAPGSPAPTDGPQASAKATLIELEETGSLQIHQNGQQISTLTVHVGETLHFRITNNAGFIHNFYIGPADELSQNLVSGLPGIPDFTQGSQEFDYTVTDETASLEWGCTVPGHYPLMHGTFVVEP